MPSPLSRFLPETLCAIVGDGSIRAGWIYTPLIPVIGRHRVMRKFDKLPPRKLFTNPLLMFTYPDIFILLILNGASFTVMYGVTTSLSVIFADIYPHLTEAEIGLCFLPMGGASIVGSWVSGKLSDYYYRKIRDDIIRQARSNSESHIDVNAVEKDPTFPIEEARLRMLPLVIFVYTTSVIGYGWALESRAPIVVPLILQISSERDRFRYFVLRGLRSHHFSYSWHGNKHRVEPYSDPVGRPDS